MFEYHAEIVMKNGEKQNGIGFVKDSDCYKEFVAFAREAHTNNPDVEKVVIQANVGGKRRYKRTFVFSELTDEQIQDINDWAVEMEIDEEDLESAKWCSNIYGVEPQYAVGGYTYDEDEYWNCQLAKALSYLDTDMAYEYFDFARSEDEDEDEDERLHKLVCDVIKAELNGYDVIGRNE